MKIIGNFRQYFSDLRLVNHVELFKIAGVRKIVYLVFSCIVVSVSLWEVLSHFIFGNPSSFWDALIIALIFAFAWFWLHVFLVASHIVIKDGELTFVDYFIKRRSYGIDSIVDASRGYLEVQSNVERVLRFVYLADADYESYDYFDIFLDSYSNDDAVMICKALGYDGLVLPKVGKHARGKDVLVAGFASDEERLRSMAEDEADKKFCRDLRREQVRKLPFAIIFAVVFSVVVMTIVYYLTRLF